ncbi:hypothetical protein LINGRAHAP2_LOCUS12970 [Linum grandiflorum]
MVRSSNLRPKQLVEDFFGAPQVFTRGGFCCQFWYLHHNLRRVTSCIAWFSYSLGSRI